MPGPNTATGHTSTIMGIENAINYSLRVLKPVLDGDATVVEIKREAEERYSKQLQQHLQKTVWLAGCRSWYTKETPDGRKWNAMTYPHSQGHYWYKCLFPVYRDWSYTVCPGVPVGGCHDILTLETSDDPQRRALAVPAQGTDDRHLAGPPCLSPGWGSRSPWGDVASVWAGPSAA